MSCVWMKNHRALFTTILKYTLACIHRSTKHRFLHWQSTKKSSRLCNFPSVGQVKVILILFYTLMGGQALPKKIHKRLKSHFPIIWYKREHTFNFRWVSMITLFFGILLCVALYRRQHKPSHSRADRSQWPAEQTAVHGGLLQSYRGAPAKHSFSTRRRQAAEPQSLQRGQEPRGPASGQHCR